MPEQVPQFDDEKIAGIALRFYGIEGEITSLVSYEDQNACIKTSAGTYVIKIANKRLSVADLNMQIEVLEHLRTTVAELVFPRVIPSKSGEKITFVDGFAIRLFTYLQGELLAHAPRSSQLYRNLGRFMGKFSTAMLGYNHPAADRSDYLWNLDNVIACKVYIEDVSDEETRACIEGVYARYEKNIAPKLKHLRQSVIHGDANDQNILVATDELGKVVGLLDFGDLQFASQVNELAILLAYTLFGVDDIAPAAAEIIHGYTEEFSLEDVELELLFDLMAMRLVQTISMSSHTAKKFPDNEYILVSVKPAQVLLKKLQEKRFMTQ